MAEKKTVGKKSFFEPVKEEKKAMACKHVGKCSDYPKLCSKCKNNPNKGWYEIKRGYFAPDDDEFEDFWNRFPKMPEFPRLMYRWF